MGAAATVGRATMKTKKIPRKRLMIQNSIIEVILYF
jgi:hypothetical protein